VTATKTVLASASSSSTTTTSATAATQSVVITPTAVPLPVLSAGSYSGVRPRTIFFSGDGTNVVVHIVWSAWSASGAVGHGTSDVESCVPSCAQGSATPVSTTVTLSAPRSGQFTSITELRNGSRYGGSRHSSEWPQNAS
jgi:hypothetical protein